MNIYKALQIGRSRIPWPFKILGLWGLHTFRRRAIAVYIDPVMGCNLRCRMCYFSDPEKRKEMHGVISETRLESVAKSLFHRAMKMQIGCGSEPTLYRDLVKLIALGRKAGIPYISLTTNGLLISTGKQSLYDMVEAGLDEITLSMHGTSREIYENLMPGADFDSLIHLLDVIAEVKRQFPDFKIRVNFTVNSLNKDDLRGKRFFDLWSKGVLPDIVQLRPVQKLGDSDWKDFDPAPLISDYDDTIGNVVGLCRDLGVTCIAPTLGNLSELAAPQGGYEAMLESLCYCYVSPQACYKSDFDPSSDTYESYHRKCRTARQLLKAVFVKPESRKRNVSKKLNYKVR